MRYFTLSAFSKGSMWTSLAPACTASWINRLTRLTTVGSRASSSSLAARSTEVAPSVSPEPASPGDIPAIMRSAWLP